MSNFFFFSNLSWEARRVARASATSATLWMNFELVVSFCIVPRGWSCPIFFRITTSSPWIVKTDCAWFSLAYQVTLYQRLRKVLQEIAFFPALLCLFWWPKCCFEFFCWQVLAAILLASHSSVDAQSIYNTAAGAVCQPLMHQEKKEAEERSRTVLLHWLDPQVECNNESLRISFVFWP